MVANTSILAHMTPRREEGGDHLIAKRILNQDGHAPMPRQLAANRIGGQSRCAALHLLVAEMIPRPQDQPHPPQA
jgi:hypothetical protein